jgi:hypothetical protein
MNKLFEKIVYAFDNGHFGKNVFRDVENYTFLFFGDYIPYVCDKQNRSDYKDNAV